MRGLRFCTPGGCVLGLLALVVGLSLAPVEAIGQETIPVRRFTALDGLPHESITDLAQTPDGRLWVGTSTDLAVYDGRRFTSIPLPDSLRSTGVTRLAAMPDGSVWITLRSWAGLVQLDNRRINRVVQFPDFQKIERLVAHGDTLFAATQDWVLTLPPGQDRFERHALPYETTAPALLPTRPNSGTGVKGVALAPGGTLWILDRRFGPGRLQPDGSVEFPFETAPPDSLWTTVQIADDGRVFATRRGTGQLTVYDPSDGSRRVVMQDLEGPNYALKAGKTLFITDGQRLRRLDLRRGVELPPLGPRLGLPATDPTTLLKDRVGTLWIGTRSGLLQLHAPSFRHVRSVNGRQIDYLGRFMTAAAGQLWIHTYGSGLIQLRPRRRRVAPEGILRWGQGVRSATASLHALAGRGWYRRSSDSDSEWQRVGDAHGAVRGYVDSSGVGYFWHDNGLFEHDPASTAAPNRLFEWAPEDRGLHQIGRSADGRLVLRAHDQLLEVHPKVQPPRIDTVAHLGEFASSRGRYMSATATGDVWIVAASGAQRGLIHVDIDAPQPRPHLHLSGEPVYWVNVSSDSVLLASARSGLFLLDAHSGAVFRHLTRSDGLLNTNTNHAALYGDSLYVSHEDGLSILPRHAAFRQPPAPAATITRVRVNHESRPVRDTLSLAASERTLDVTYAAPYLRNPRRVTYEYRLASQDTAWHATNRATRQFSALEPGRHKFEVRARIGASAGPSARLVVSIAPFFYETWWFWGLCGIALTGLVVMGYRWRVYQLQERQARLERAVADRTEELRAEKEKTEAQAERLAELDEAKNRFFANLSHEFRTPLTLITEPLRGLLHDSESLPAPLPERLRPMLRNAKRLERLIDQLLDLSKSTAGRLELQRRPVDLVALARNSLEAFVPLAERHDVELHLRSDVDALPASADPDKLDKILSNLLSNAIKFTEAGGTVWLTVTRAPGAKEKALLVVKDTGVGIPEADLRRIFDRFEQVDGSITRRQEGTGIGLALTRELVELHGGTIGVESEPGKGSAFTVQLPLGDPTGDGAEELAEMSGDGVAGVTGDLPVPESAPASASDASGDAPTLLVVDDNADVRAFLHRELGGSYEVETAATGTQALDRIRESAPDVVVSDVMMPEMDGFALCEAIKSDDVLRTIPVLLLTARAEADDAVEGLEHGADDYVAKPFDLRELEQRIERLLEVRATLQSEYEQIVHVEAADLEVADDQAAFVEAVLTAIHDSIDDPELTVDRLAQAVALSRRQLTRRLRDATGESPAALIRRIRLEQAAARLEDTEHPRIADLAHAVGFRTVSHFSKAFKKHFGCPPSQYPADS